MTGIDRKYHSTISRLKDGKVDIDSLEAIAFDPYTHGYYKVNGRVGEAFKDGRTIYSVAFRRIACVSK